MHKDKKSIKRKNIRIKDYDYAQNGCYFVTICSNHKANIFWLSGEDAHFESNNYLTEVGIEVEKAVQYINEQMNGVVVDKHITMPNHIHMIIRLTSERRENLPLHQIIAQFKSYTNRAYNRINKSSYHSLWQRNYYEHIIRSEKDYRGIWQYIENNPIEWKLDEYYDSK